MKKRLLSAAVLLALVALPFVLRTRNDGLARADDTVVIVSPHNEAIRYEFGRAFAAWYRARTGRTVRVDWRVIGGTSEIARYLESAYASSFENEWVGKRHQTWSADVENGFQNAALPKSASPAAQKARLAFLASNTGCGIDLFFGGDAYEYDKEARIGRLVDAGLMRRHPEWFSDDKLPLRFGGEPFRDPDGRWFGAVLSTYGIIYNRDSWNRLGAGEEPTVWADLAKPQLQGEVALADPTKSGSVCEAFEHIIQQQIRRQMKAPAPNGNDAPSAADEATALRTGWIQGLRLIQKMGANARYFTDTSQKPPIDVADGDCAAGLCIDFYGRQQQEAVMRRGSSHRIGYVSPRGGSAVSTDPIGLLRGAPHRDVAIAFMEFTLSLEGQKLWAFRPGTPGGPERFALRRTPVRRDFYRHSEWTAERSDPADDPYDQIEPFVYHPEWTGGLFREIGFITRIMCLDTHAELTAAWRAINAAPEPARSRALAVLQDLAPVEYDRAQGEIHRRLTARDRVEEVRLASEMTDWFRANYARAAAIARGR